MPKGTYSLIGRQMPRFREGQRQLSTSTLNAPLETLERTGLLTAAGCGLALEQMPNGVNVRALPPNVGKIAVVTTAVPKMVAPNPGVGKGELQALINGVLSPTGVTADLYSILTDKIISVGAYVKVGQVDGQWFVDTVDACAHLTSSAGPVPPPVPSPGSSGGALAPVVAPSSADAAFVAGSHSRFTFVPGSPVQGG